LLVLDSAQAQHRIVTLTPHATEMVFAAGAGHLIVATVESSNFPAQARQLPKLGNGHNTSLEQVAAVQPDYVIGWPSPLMEHLLALGFQTHLSQPKSVQGIIDEILFLGNKFNTLDAATKTANELEQQIIKPKVIQTREKPLKVVVLADPEGIYVIGNDPLINEAIRTCGAINPFAEQSTTAPKVNRESMISANPDLIVTGHMPNPEIQKIAPTLVIDEDLLYRPGPRFLQAIKLLCSALERL